MEQKQYTPYRSHMPLMNPLYGTPERIVQYSKVAGYFPEKMVAEFDKLTLRQKKVFVRKNNFKFTKHKLKANPIMRLRRKQTTSRLKRSIDPNLTIEQLVSTSARLYDWGQVSLHKNITYEHIRTNPRLLFNVEVFYMNNPNATIEIFMENLNKLTNNKTREEYISAFSCNRNLTIEHVLKNPNVAWDMWAFSGNGKFTMKDVKNTNLDWQYGPLSRNKNISCADILANKQFDWEYENLADKPDFNIEVIKTYMRLNIQYEGGWIWPCFSESEYIFPEDIDNNLHLPWSWNQIASRNPNITEEFVKKHSDKLPFREVLKNTLYLHPRTFERQSKKFIEKRRNKIKEILRDCMIAPFLQIVGEYIDFM